MFANSRMFWNVRPIPKRTISLGRALRKIPARCRRCTYHGGRMIATMSEPIRSPIDISTSSSPPISMRAAMLTAAKTPNTTGKANQKNGSAQVRRGRETTGSPANEIVPSLGSRRPAMTLKKVVLPAPLGPMRLTIEPSGMSKSIVRTATRPPKRFEIPRASSRRPRLAGSDEVVAGPAGAAAGAAGAAGSGPPGAGGVVASVVAAASMPGSIGSVIRRIALRARSGPSGRRPSARPRPASRGARVACAGSGTGPRV